MIQSKIIDDNAIPNVNYLDMLLYQIKCRTAGTNTLIDDFLKTALNNEKAFTKNKKQRVIRLKRYAGALQRVQDIPYLKGEKGLPKMIPQFQGHFDRLISTVKSNMLDIFCRLINLSEISLQYKIKMQQQNETPPNIVKEMSFEEWINVINNAADRLPNISKNEKETYRRQAAVGVTVDLKRLSELNETDERLHIYAEYPYGPSKTKAELVGVVPQKIIDTRMK